MTRSTDGLRPTTRLAHDEGSTLLLTMFYALLALVLILLVIAATSLYLERKRLFSFADGAALVGAEAFDLAEVSLTVDGPRVILHSDDVAAAVTRFLASVPDPGFESLALERALSVDGRSATVSMSAYWRPPVLTLFVPEGIRIEVTARARSVFS